MDVAFILLRTATPPKADDIVEHAKRYGLALTPESTEPGKASSFKIAGAGAFIAMLIDAPHPAAAHPMSGPTSAAPEEVKAAKAHFIVTAMGLEGTVRQRDAKMAGLAAAVAAASDAVGVQLAHGLLFHKAELYCELAGLALETGELPSEIAVDITTATEAKGRMSFLTHGMPRYGREELYVTAPVGGRGALGFVFEMSRWLLTDRDKKLPTGDTVGRTPEEQIIVQRVPNPTGKGDEVVRLDLP